MTPEVPREGLFVAWVGAQELEGLVPRGEVRDQSRCQPVDGRCELQGHCGCWP